MKAEVFEKTTDPSGNLNPTGKHRKVRRGDHVQVIKDCRKKVPSANGLEAVYEGNYWYGTSKRYRGPNDHFLEVNPRFRLADGSHIFGIECWWVLLPKPKEDRKEGLSKKA
jgi:hypothetical protein